MNAYRRMMAESLAPTHVNWGYDNRLALLRFPGERDARTRAEIRGGDGAANPYLALGAVPLAGLDGIRNGLDRWRRRLALVTDWERDEYAHHL